MQLPAAFTVRRLDSATRGAPTAVLRHADGREIFLHSRHDPIEEARFLIQDVPSQEHTMYVVAGFGLGYHVKELLRRIPPSSHVVVMEPESARLSDTALESGTSPTAVASASVQVSHKERGKVDAWRRDPRLHFFSLRDANVAPLTLTECLTHFKLRSIKLIPHLPSTWTAPHFYQTLMSVVPREFPTAIRRRLDALDQRLENDLLNFWVNLGHSWNAAAVSGLRGAWSKRPLCIISAGPSLTDALPALRRLEQPVLLLATAQTGRLLTAQQIRPDLVISIDPYPPNLAHFTGWNPHDVPLVYYHRIYPGILPLYPGPTLPFVMRDEPPLPLTASPERSHFSRGGTVTYSALQLAHYLGADPIIFIGLDFAFAGGHTHAAGMIYDQPFDEHALRADQFLVRGTSGGQVATNRTYYDYLLLMQDYLLNVHGHLPPAEHVTHINTSRIGAAILGTESRALEDVLQNLAPSGGASARETITPAWRARPQVPDAARRAALGRWIKELDRLLAGDVASRGFDRLFAAFRQTSVYAQAANHYDDLSYVYDATHRHQSTGAAFIERFTSHLRSVAATLRGMRAAAP